jgi:hypothetical protein
MKLGPRSFFKESAGGRSFLANGASFVIKYSLEFQSVFGKKEG